MVFVPLERHLAVHRVLEEHQRLTIAAALGAQTQSHATPVVAIKLRELGEIIYVPGGQGVSSGARPRLG